MLSNLFASTASPTTAVSSHDENEQEMIKRALACAESATSTEVYLRRDAHGGFGLFFYGKSTVIRHVVSLLDGNDGRASLVPGDVVTRVGGMPATDVNEANRLLRQADNLVSLTVAKSSEVVKMSEDNKNKVDPDEEWDDQVLDGEPVVSRVSLRTLALLLKRPVRNQDTSWLSNIRGGASDSFRPMNAAAKSLVQRVTTQLNPSPVSTNGSPRNISQGGNQCAKAAAWYISSLSTSKESSLPSPPSTLFVPGIESTFLIASQSNNNSLPCSLSRELRRCGDVSKRILEAADKREDAFGVAAARLARASKNFVQKLEAAQRPEMATSQSTGWQLELLILSSPELVLFGSGVLPLASALLSSGYGTQIRRVERSVKEIERREQHASQLCQMNRSLRDEAVRSLSDTDLDLAVRAAFAELSDAVIDRDEAQKQFCHVLNIAEACAESLPPTTVQNYKPQFQGLARGPANKNGSSFKQVTAVRTTNKVFEQSLPQVASSRPGRLVAFAQTTAGVLVRGTRQRLERCRQGVTNLELCCALDADEARACYAAAKSQWAENDAEVTERLVAEFSARETELAHTAKTMAQRIATHADALANLADSARDRLLAILQPEEEKEKECDLSAYFELSAESIEARSDLVRRQIQDRERVIAALNNSAKELALAQIDWEKMTIQKAEFRQVVFRRYTSRLTRLSDCQLATSRSRMLGTAASATIEADLKACADDLIDLAHNLARLDVELRLAHLRLVSLALRVEIDRAQRWWADHNKHESKSPSKRGRRVFLLFEAVNGTKRELHRIRDDYLNQHTRISSSKATSLEDALAQLAELEILGAKVAAVADAESEEFQAEANRRRLKLRNAAVARRNSQIKNDPTLQAQSVDSSDSYSDHLSSTAENADVHQRDSSTFATHDDLQIAAFASPYDEECDQSVHLTTSSGSSPTDNSLVSF